MLLEDAALYWTTAPVVKLFWIMRIWRSFHKPAYARLFSVSVSDINVSAKIFPVLVIQSVIDSLTCVLISALGFYIYPKNAGFLLACRDLAQPFCT